ncbi:MAG TPA: endospore germination permease [Bacillota bacterium]|nr:endospore germination permease [Bacillota bacterium]
MLTEKTGIGAGLFFILVFQAVVGYGMLNAPYLAAKYIGASGYWGPVLAFGEAFLVIWIIHRLGKRFPNQFIIAYAPRIFGKWLGAMIGLVYILFMLGLTLLCVRMFAGHFGLYFLVRTPGWVINGAILLTVFYLSRKGIEGISRLASFLFILPLSISILTLVFSFQNFQLDNLKPFFHLSGNRLMMGLVHSFNSFLPLSMLFMVYQYLTDGQKGFRMMLTATGLASIFILGIVISSLGTFGAVGVTRLSWTFTEVTKQAEVPFILQSFNLFYSPVFLIQTVIGASSFYYAAAQGSAEYFKKLNFKQFQLIFLPVIFLAAIWFKSDIMVRKLFEYFRVAGFILIFVVPIIIWLMAVLFKKGVNNAPK